MLYQLSYASPEAAIRHGEPPFPPGNFRRPEAQVRAHFHSCAYHGTESKISTRITTEQENQAELPATSSILPRHPLPRPTRNGLVLQSSCMRPSALNLSS